MGRPARWIALTLQTLLALLFAFSATTKLTGGMDDIRDLLGVAPWFWTLAGVWQTIGAVALVAGLRSARVAVAGALWLTVVMGGAVVTHIAAGDALTDMSVALALLVLLLLVAALRWRDAHLSDLLPTGSRRIAAARPDRHGRPARTGGF